MSTSPESVSATVHLTTRVHSKIRCFPFLISLRSAIVGSPETVRPGLEAFFERTGADEIMVTTKLFEHADRLRFYKILSHLMKELKVPEKTGTQAAS